jgi:hypothetical protein
MGTQRWAVGQMEARQASDLVELDELRDGVTHLDGNLHHVPRGCHGPACRRRQHFPRTVPPPSKGTPGQGPLGATRMSLCP